MKKLKVYGWQSFRRECKPAPNGSTQTREICAAHSKVEAARVAGYDRPAQMFNLCETGNAGECELAIANPGVVFWKPLNDFSNSGYRRAPTTGEKP